MANQYRGKAPAKRKKKRRINKRRLRQLVARLITFIIIVIAAFLGFQYFSVQSEVKMEASKENSFDAAKFSKFGSKPVRAGEETYDLSVPGEYTYKIRNGLFVRNVKVVVVDTTAPVVEVDNVTVTLGTKFDPQKCASKVEDFSKVTVTCKNDVDTSTMGAQNVTLVFTDAFNNKTEKQMVLLVSPFKDEVTVEAGSEQIDATSLAVTSIDTSLIVSESIIDMNHVKDQDFEIDYDGYSFTTTVHVVDTITPEVEVKDLEGYRTAEYTGLEFAKSISDATDVTATLDKEIDLKATSAQSFQVTFTDEGGNSVTKSVVLTLKDDEEAPVIACPDEHIMPLGESILFSDLVTVTDNCFNQYKLDIDKGGLDVDTVGDYNVKFVATDAAGNSSSRTMLVQVIESAYSQEQVDALADKVLAEITTDSMSQVEKCRAIYDWMHEYVRYISHSDKGDWRKAAYEGLANREGDCYVFAMTAKELLTRAGIKNMDIEKIPAKSRHYWSLVDVGTGWLHFDTCPRVVWHNFCLITDADLMEYSNENNLSHNYDHSKYPKVN